MIELNFLGIKKENNPIQIFIKEYNEADEKNEEIFVHRLEDSNTQEYKRYFISFTNREGFTAVNYELDENINLSKRFLQYHLATVCTENNFTLKRNIINSKFSRRIEFILEETAKGERVIFLAPYFLKTKRKFGFLIDYRFKKKEDIPFDIDIQKYSLSLDKNGKENKNLYVDKKRIITWFIKNHLQGLNQILSHFSVKTQLSEMHTHRLNKKEYVFNSHRTSQSQFNGIKMNGPFQKVNVKAHYVFIFEDKFIAFSRDLYQSLKGKLYPGTFSGLEAMFSLNFSKEDISRINIQGYKKENLDVVISKLIEIKKEHEKVIAVFIEPSRDTFEDISPYYYLKYQLTKNRIPLQVLDHENRSKRNALKWSSSGLGLQIFSKLGGMPWVVKPNVNNCLILGIGSAHKEKDGIISKYFSYSICLDSSGVYKKLSVLSEKEDKESFLNDLTKNLINLFKDKQLSNYQKCALHIPSKIKYEELEAIYDAISTIKKVEFQVIKVNLNNRFFGFSNHNTCVPYESEYFKLSKNEYLVWFEGLQYGKEMVYRRVGGPVHLEFLKTIRNDENNQIKNSNEDYLQDVLNLSGANWRGFNAKLMPISIYYSQIVARYTAAFEEFDDYDPSLLKYNLPWFDFFSNGKGSGRINNRK